MIRHGGNEPNTASKARQIIRLRNAVLIVSASAEWSKLVRNGLLHFCKGNHLGFFPAITIERHVLDKPNLHILLLC